MRGRGPLYVLICYWRGACCLFSGSCWSGWTPCMCSPPASCGSMVFTGAILLFRRDRFAGVRAAFRDRREWGLLAAAGCVICVNWASISGR